jgi:hypothetical protein
MPITDFWTQWLTLLFRLLAILAVAFGVDLGVADQWPPDPCDSPDHVYTWTVQEGDPSGGLPWYDEIAIDLVLSEGSLDEGTFVAGGEITCFPQGLSYEVFAWNAVWHYDLDPYNWHLPLAAPTQSGSPDWAVQGFTVLEDIPEGATVGTFTYLLIPTLEEESLCFAPQLSIYCIWNKCSCYKPGCVDLTGVTPIDPPSQLPG